MLSEHSPDPNLEMCMKGLVTSVLAFTKPFRVMRSQLSRLVVLC